MASAAVTVPLPDPAAAGRIRQVSVSGALDEAIRIVHDNPRDLFRVSAVLMAVPLWGAIYFGTPPAIELLDAWVAATLEGEPIDLVPPLRRFVSVTISWSIVAQGICQPLALGAIVMLSSGVLTGHQTTFGEALRHSLRCGVPLVVMWFVRGLLVQLGSILCYVPGILLVGLYVCALPALVLERLGPIQALNRSIALNKKRLGESVLLVLLLGLIEWLVTQFGQLLPAGVPQSAGTAVLYAGMLTVYGAAGTVFYFSGRCQRENYDLQLWVQTLVSRDELETLAAGESTLFGRQPAG